MEGRTLIFLHAEAHTAPVDSNGKAAIQQTLWQREVNGTLAIIVGDSRLLCHDFVVGIAQFELHIPAADSLVVQGRNLLPYDSCGMNGLTRAIDAAVCKQIDMLTAILPLIVVIAAIAILNWTILISTGESKDVVRPFVVTHRIDGLAIGTTGQFLILLGFLPPRTEGQPHLGPTNGLTRNGIDHNIAHLFVGHGERHQADIGNKAQVSDHFRSGLAFDFHQIDTHGQTLQLQRILKPIVVSMTCKRGCLPPLFHFLQARLDFLVVLVALRIQVGITLQVGFIDPQGKTLQIAQLQLDGLRLV